ncbi:MAG: class I SAM-dependent methyltransferase [gamma proteobacterium symbiont of Clathrolucina costata]
MDKITAEVQAFYEAYPYPPDGHVNCDGYHARLLLSYLQRTNDDSGRIHVLEAGCGRGLNLLAAAERQTDIDFTGVDINRVAIAEATHRSKQRGIDNLRYFICDLLDHESLPVREGGYQVILSYGVLTHLSNPLLGLRHISRLLAPQGVIAIMLDGSYGWQPLDRYLQALSIIDHDCRSMDRLSMARALADAAETTLFNGNCWQGTASVDDIEFADRCLHVHQKSYDIAGLWRLLDSAGLRFIRWLEPNDWEIRQVIDNPELLRLIDSIDDMKRFQLTERLKFLPKFTLLVSRREDKPRPQLLATEVAATQYAFNPQLMLERKGEHVEGCRLRGRRVDLNSHPLTHLVLDQAAQLSDEFPGQQLIDRLLKQNLGSQLIIQGIIHTVEHELLYRPHAVGDDLT